MPKHDHPSTRQPHHGQEAHTHHHRPHPGLGRQGGGALQNHELAQKARQRWQTSRRGGTKNHHQTQQHRFAHGYSWAQLVLCVTALRGHLLYQQEQTGNHHRAVQHVVQRGRQCLRCQHAHRRQNGAHRGHGQVRHQPVHAVRRQGTQHAQHTGGQGQGQEPRPGGPSCLACLGTKNAPVNPDDGIDPHLGHDGKQRGHRRTGRCIGARQPKIQRHQRSLQAKHHQQQQGSHPRQHRAVTRNLAQPQGNIRHVECAGGRVQHRQPDQEQARCHQIQHHVVDAHAQALAALAVQKQHIRGNQQHLEKHEQVEQVARQKSPAQAHELELEHRMEVAPPHIPAAAGVPQHGHRHQIGQQHHEGRELIDQQDDAKRRRPLAHPVYQQVARTGMAHQLHRHEQPQQHRGQRHPTAPALPGIRLTAVCARPVTNEQQDHRRERRQHHRQHGGVLEPEGSKCIPHQAAPVGLSVAAAGR